MDHSYGLFTKGLNRLSLQLGPVKSPEFSYFVPFNVHRRFNRFSISLFNEYFSKSLFSNIGDFERDGTAATSSYSLSLTFSTLVGASITKHEFLTPSCRVRSLFWFLVDISMKTFFQKNSFCKMKLKVMMFDSNESILHTYTFLAKYVPSSFSCYEFAFG